MSTDSRGTGEQPTTPIPQTRRGDDPTQIFETFPAADARGASAAGRVGDASAEDAHGAGNTSEQRRHEQGTEAPDPVGTAASAAPPARPPSRTPRVRTVVWGLVVAIIGAGLVAVGAGARFDPELVLIGLLAVAGIALVAGSMAVSLRRRH